jgi:hypothetical protein
MPGVKIVTELEPIKMYYKAEVRDGRDNVQIRSTQLCMMQHPLRLQAPLL